MPIFAAPDPDPPSWTPQRVHLACYVLLAILFAYVLVDRYFRPLVLQPAVGIEGVEPTWVPASRPVETRIDPNLATWAELARLPGVGERMAKSIVAYRDENRPRPLSDGTVPPVFRTVDDLRAIQGIGAKTIDRIAPLLKLSGDPLADDLSPAADGPNRFPVTERPSPFPDDPDNDGESRFPE